MLSNKKGYIHSQDETDYFNNKVSNMKKDEYNLMFSKESDHY